MSNPKQNTFHFKCKKKRYPAHIPEMLLPIIYCPIKQRKCNFYFRIKKYYEGKRPLVNCIVFLTLQTGERYSVCTQKTRLDLLSSPGTKGYIVEQLLPAHLAVTIRVPYKPTHTGIPSPPELTK